MFPTWQRDVLGRWLPVELACRLDEAAPLTLAEQRAITRHLQRLLASLEVSVPGWVRAALDDAPAPAVQRRDATVLLADISGFTPLTARLEALGRSGNEHLTSVINQLFEALVGEALAHGGDLLAFGGDAVLVAFGGAGHVAAAARAALAMRAALARAAALARVPLPEQPSLQIRIGVASGPLVLLRLNTGQRRHALPLGGVLDTVDAMANVPGGIRLDPLAAARADRGLRLARQPDGSALLLDAAPSAAPPFIAPFAPPSSFDALLARVQTLAAYLPPDVLANLVAAPDARPGDGEQRHVISLFAHLDGLHELADTLGERDLARVAEATAASIGRVLASVEEAGGILARIDAYPGGHKLLALFGAPTARERDAERAVRVALAMRPLVEAANGDLATQWEALERRERSVGGVALGAAPRLRVRVGVNAGQVVAGIVGSSARYEYTVMGDSVNVGARLMGSASLERGEVLVGGQVYAALTKQLDAEERVLTVKGKAAPISAWRARSFRQYASPRRPSVTPLVGRAAELARLAEVVAALRQGEGRVIMFEGEAGIGKTRLARALVATLGPTLCLHSGAHGLAQPSFALFRGPLQALCGAGPRLALAEARDRVEHTVATLLPEEGAALLPALHVLLGLPLADDASLGDTPEAQGRALARAVGAVFTAVARQQPLAWICEDLHDADAASLDLLHALLRTNALPPMLVCATTRPLRNPIHPAAPVLAAVRATGTVLEIGGLDGNAGDALLGALLPELAPAARNALLALGGGNPLFIELLVRSLQQRGAFESGAEGLVLRALFSDMTAPPTLRELVTAQIDLLPAEVRRLARAAAVIASAERVVDRALLEAVADEPQAVAARLRALEEAQVVERIADAYAFRHALFQQAAYDRLQERERRALHRRAGRVLQAAQADAPGRLEALAFHSYAGQDWELAAPATLEAGRRARQLYANRDARRALRRALGLARRLQLPAQEAAAREELGALYALVGRYTPARAQIERALRYGDSDNEATARRYRLLALIDERTGRYAEAEGHCQAGLGLLAEAILPNLEVAWLHAQRADVCLRQGNFVASAAACLAGLAALPPAPEALRERVTLLQRLGMLHGERGRYSDAIRALEQSLPLAQQIGDGALTAQILHNLGNYVSFNGNSAAALDYYKESLRLKEQVGDIAGRILTINGLGSIYLAQCEYEAALRHYTEAYTLSSQIGRPASQALALLNIGCLHYEQEHFNEARQYLLQATATYEALKDTSRLAHCMYMLGDIALANSEPAAALDYGGHALALARQAGSIVFASCAQRVRGEALLALGQLAAAQEALDEAAQLQAEVGDPYDHARIVAAQAHLAHALGDDAATVAHATTALALAHERRIGFLVAPLEALLAQARVEV